MSIPDPVKTSSAMRFLIARARNRPMERIALAELNLAAGFTEAEGRFFFNTLFPTGLFRAVGPDSLFTSQGILGYEARLPVCSFGDVHSYANGLASRQRLLRILPAILAAKRTADTPVLTLKAILEFGDRTDDGRLIQCVAIPWFEIVTLLERDPSAAYAIDPFKWEEIIAGAYVEAGFDEVILTPRSGDNGRDVVATKKGIGSIRIFDQVKAYKPGHLVTAEEVRALAGTLFAAQNVSKGVVTTTSDFAPRIETHDFVRSLIPYRLELKNRASLLQWLTELKNIRGDAV